MAKTVIFSIITIAVLIGFQQSYSIPEIDDEVVVGFEHGDAKAIPDWVRTTMGFYLKDQISEREILDTFNYLFENNIMHLSQEAAQEVQEMRNEIDDLKQELEETKAAIAIPNLIEARKGANESSTSGERIMQPEFGAGDNTQTKVIVRGWDPEQKESTTEANKESIQRFVVELYAESMSLSQDAIWLPMIEGEVLTGFEGDMDRPIIIGRIYNTESSQSYPIVPSQTKVLIMASTSDFDFASQTVDDVLRKGGTVSAWEDGIEAFKTDSVDRSAIPELQGIVVLCNIEIDKKIQRIDAELEIIEQWLEIISKEQESSSVDTPGRLASGDTGEYVQQYNQSDLDFIKRHLIHIDQQIKALDTGVGVFEEKLSSIGDDAQLANIDLQNALQKQQQTLQTISNVSKMHHDTMMSIINNMR
jgi:hypothetical protein